MRGHWRGLLIELVILASMLIVALINGDLYVILISISIIVLPAVDWTVFGVLLWTSRRAPDIKSLSDGVENARTLAVASTVAAGVGGLVLLRLLGFITESVTTLLAVGLGYIVVAISLPAIRFLQTWLDVWLPLVRNRESDTLERPDGTGGDPLDKPAE